jgi:DNA polymerase I-like protein with 3'-5' exonuclease and polymerase domains
MLTCKVHTMSTPLSRGVLVLDVETALGKDGSPRAIEGASIFMLGVADGNSDTPYSHTWRGLIGETFYLAPFKLVIGHNIKFDFDHIRRSKSTIEVKGVSGWPTFWEYLWKSASVWDTQFLTYLHSGHKLKFPTLDESCVYFGVPMKKSLDIGKALEENEYDISRIKDLDKYLANDLDMTHELFLKQYADPWVQENIQWVLAMMQGLLGTFEIEFNGTHVNPDTLVTLKGTATKNLAMYEELIAHLVEGQFGKEVAENYNPSSPAQLGILLYGGKLEWDQRVPVGVYMTGDKMGQTRHKIVKKEFDVPDSPFKPFGPSTDDDALLSISSGLASFETMLAEYTRHYRAYAKLNGTYLSGLEKHIKVGPDENYYVFPQINLCQTNTGRTSSSKPNMQNNPTHDIVGVRKIYTSRYGKDACLVEVDFKQIEVVALAILSQDSQLLSDIAKGVDIHAATGEKVFKGAMTKEQRRIVKTINFGLIYGGGAETLAQQAKVHLSIATKCVNAFYARYPRTKEYFEEFKQETQRLMDTKGLPNGMQLDTPIGTVHQKRVLWTSKTGRRYGFKDYWSDYEKRTVVSHTETRNYPIQGLATGDLVLCALGQVWRRILPHYKDSCKLVGLIHDSLVFDVKLDKLDEFLVELKTLLESSGTLLTRACKDFEWSLPVKVEISTGETLGELKELTR